MSKKCRFLYSASLLLTLLTLIPSARATNSRRPHRYGHRQFRRGRSGHHGDDRQRSDETHSYSSDTSDTGSYSFVNLPIGNYTITFTHAGFLTLNIPSIQVQANRTATVNAALKIGEVAQTVTVDGDSPHQRGRHDERLRDGQSGNR